MSERDNIQWCRYCRCKTWHFGFLCEWRDLHMSDTDYARAEEELARKRDADEGFGD